VIASEGPVTVFLGKENAVLGKFAVKLVLFGKESVLRVFSGRKVDRYR